jgi:hypothetical protein
MSNLREVLFKKFKESHPDATESSPEFRAFIKNMESTSKIMKKKSKSPKRRSAKKSKSPKRYCSPKARRSCSRKSRLCNPLTGNCILPQTALNAGLKLESRRMPRRSRVRVEKVVSPIIPQYTSPSKAKELVSTKPVKISKLAIAIDEKNKKREGKQKPLAIEGPKVMNLPVEQINALVPAITQSDANKVLENVDNQIQAIVGVNPQVSDPKIAIAVAAVPDEIREQIIHGVSPNIKRVMDMSFTNDPNALILQIQYLLNNAAEAIKAEETLKDVAEQNDNEEFFDAVEESQEQLIEAAMNAEIAAENLELSIESGQDVEENVSTLKMAANAVVNVVKESVKQVLAPGAIMALLTYGTLALSNALAQGTAGPIPVYSGNVTEPVYALPPMGFKSKVQRSRK